MSPKSEEAHNAGTRNSELTNGGVPSKINLQMKQFDLKILHKMLQNTSGRKSRVRLRQLKEIVNVNNSRFPKHMSKIFRLYFYNFAFNHLPIFEMIQTES